MSKKALVNKELEERMAALADYFGLIVGIAKEANDGKRNFRSGDFKVSPSVEEAFVNWNGFAEYMTLCVDDHFNGRHGAVPPEVVPLNALCIENGYGIVSSMFEFPEERREDNSPFLTITTFFREDRTETVVAFSFEILDAASEIVKAATAEC